MAPTGSLPTAQLPSEAAASRASSASQEQPSPVINFPPLRAAGDSLRQDALQLPDLSAQQEQEDTKPPAKRQKTKEDTLTQSTALGTDDTARQPYDVFISHAGEDKETIAEPLYKALKNHGVKSFFDREELRTGEHAPSNMLEAMKNALCGVFILSPEFAAKRWPMKELYCFLDRQEEAKKQDCKLPYLIPVFYRLPYEACNAPADLFECYSDIFLNHGFNGRMYEGETSRKQVRDALQQLSNHTGIKAKVTDRAPQLVQSIAEELYGKVTEVRPLHEATDPRCRLAARYADKNFALAKSLFPGERPHHVKDLSCTLQLIEKSSQHTSHEVSQDEFTAHHEQNKWKKTPITLDDLFKSRVLTQDGPARMPDKLLIIGAPGTGKTTLSKQLAYRWAEGKWGKEFNAVYVLPVRRLKKSEYNNRTTLATAIVNTCFTPPSDDTAYMALCKQIAEQLKQPTTLVVLDGLDERSGASEALLSQATRGPHKLLMLSRAYEIEHAREIADIEVEHTGLRDAQVHAYVNNVSGLPREQGEELLSLLGQDRSISEIAQVPVNLQILCFLWRDETSQTDVRKAVRQGSLPGLYRVVTRAIWKRYVARTKALETPIEDREALFDTLGKIALEALKRGEILISAELVDELVEASSLKYPDVTNMQDTGFLLLQWLQGSGQYQFPHLTFQEYFAGGWLAKKLFASDEKAKAQAFFKEHKYVPQYGRIFSFMAGEVSHMEKKESIYQLLSLTNEDPREIVGVQHVLLQMRLLNEWLCVSEEEEVEREWPALEKEFNVVTSFKEWIDMGIHAVQEHENWKLLSLVTRALQDFRAVKRQAATQILLALLAACKNSYNAIKAAIEALGEVAQSAPTVAEQCLPVLLGACRDGDSDAAKALGKVVTATPQLAEQALSALLATCKDRRYNVRKAALRGIGEVAKSAPALAEQCLPMLLEGWKVLKDMGIENGLNTEDVAYVALGKIVATTPSLAEQYFPVLLEACKDGNEDWFVRYTTIEALGEVVKSAPALAEQCLPMLLEAYKDPDGCVCIGAQKAIREVVSAAPQLAEQILLTLVTTCKDELYKVRQASVRALVEVVKSAPALAEQCLPVLLEACKDEEVIDHDLPYGNVQVAEVLGEFVAAAPSLAVQCLPVLLEACKDTDLSVHEVTREAISVVANTIPHMFHGSEILSTLLEILGKFVAATPQLAGQCLPVLLEACKDTDLSVREVAREAIGKVGLVAPALAEQCLPVLLEACKDSDNIYRDTEVLVKFIATAPAFAEQILSAIVSAYGDTNSTNRSSALWALDKFSLRQLLEGYWVIPQKQAILFCIANRLYQTPLMVNSSLASHHARMVWYDTAGKLDSWDRPQKEIDRFVDSIRQEVLKKENITTIITQVTELIDKAIDKKSGLKFGLSGKEFLM